MKFHKPAMGSVPLGLATNYSEGGYKTGEGHMKFYLYEKMGGKSFSHAEGGGGGWHNKF